MQKWTVYDRDGREIYLTEERWRHIVTQHQELQGHREDVLTPVRKGKRRQQPQDQQTYVYRLRCKTLPSPFNGILVVVAFRFELQEENGKMIPNNFIVTAWGILMR